MYDFRAPLTLLLLCSGTAATPAPVARPALLAAPAPTRSAAPAPVPADSIRRDLGLQALTSVASSVSAGSVALLVFAALSRRTVPTRSLAAALAVAATSIGLDLIGIGGLGRRSLAGCSLSEAGQALAIAACGWAAFSAVWAAGYGSVLNPGSVATLNLAGFGGTLLGAAIAAATRPPSRAQTTLPFVSALVLMHMHLVVRPNVEELRLAPLALSTAALALSAICFDGAARTSAAHKRPPPAEQRRGRSGAAAEGRVARWLRGVRGSADLVPAALAVNLFWTALTLGKWTFQECPSWGLAALAASTSGIQVALQLYAARPGERMLGPKWAYAYTICGWHLAAVAAWRALWPDGEAVPRLEAHFLSLVSCFGTWGAGAALLEQPVTAVVGALMVALVVLRVVAGSLFESQPLARLGVLGLGAGVAVLALIVKVGDDLVDGSDGAWEAGA